MIKIYDPLVLLCKIFEERFPGKTATVEFVDGIDHKKFLGDTCFAEDGNIYIQVSVNQNMPQLLDVTAHELAHLAAGVEAGHGKQWADIYKWLFDEFNNRMQQEETK